MRYFLFITLLLAGNSASANDRQDCSSSLETKAPAITDSEVPRRISAGKMERHLERILKEGKRLEYRGALVDGEYVVPHFAENGPGQRDPDAVVRFPLELLQIFASHVGQALAKGYANFPFFPDLGHGHVMVTEKRFQELTSDPQYTTAGALNALFKGKEFKILYHAGEHLEYIDEKNAGDARLRFLRENRNIVGEIGDDGTIFTIKGDGKPNTASRIPEMQEIGIFYFSLTNSGCIPFRYKDRDLFLDFSTTF